MLSNPTPIIIKKEGVSDNSYKIIELYVKNKSKVKKGDLIVCLETSKIALDIESPKSGFIFFNKTKNEEVKIGQTLAVISENENFKYKDWFKSLTQEKTEINNINTVKISKPAQRLINDNNIDIAEFEGAVIITKQDVEKYLSVSQKKEEILELGIKDNSIVIFAGGGHAKMCIELIKQTQTYNIIGILDDNKNLPSKILNIPVIGSSKNIDSLIKKGLKNIIIGVGGIFTKELKIKSFQKFKDLKLHIPTIIHPSSSVEPSVTYGEGNQIMQGAIIGSTVKIGNNCIINSGSIISHDTIIGNNVHIAPGAIIGGGVIIKDNTIIGMGATIFLGLTIGKNVIIQNGINVFKNIEDNSHVKKDSNL